VEFCGEFTVVGGGEFGEEEGLEGMVVVVDGGDGGGCWW